MPFSRRAIAVAAATALHDDEGGNADECHSTDDQEDPGTPAARVDDGRLRLHQSAVGSRQHGICAIQRLARTIEFVSKVGDPSLAGFHDLKQCHGVSSGRQGEKKEGQDAGELTVVERSVHEWMELRQSIGKRRSTLD